MAMLRWGPVLVTDRARWRIVTLHMASTRFLSRREKLWQSAFNTFNYNDRSRIEKAYPARFWPTVKISRMERVWYKHCSIHMAICFSLAFLFIPITHDWFYIMFACLSIPTYQSFVISFNSFSGKCSAKVSAAATIKSFGAVTLVS